MVELTKTLVEMGQIHLFEQWPEPGVDDEEKRVFFDQLADVVAVEVTGGPTIDFVPVRKDSKISTKEGCRPDAKQGSPHLKDIFYRMGLSDKDIVAISGAHTLVLKMSSMLAESAKLGE